MVNYFFEAIAIDSIEVKSHSMQANSIGFEVNSILAYSIDFIRFKSYSMQAASTDSIAVMIHFMPTNSIEVENHSKLEHIQNYFQLLFSRVFLFLTVHFFLFEFLLDSIRVEIYFVQANSINSLWVEIEICSRLATKLVASTKKIWRRSILKRLKCKLCSRKTKYNLSKIRLILNGSLSLSRVS